MSNFLFKKSLFLFSYCNGLLIASGDPRRLSGTPGMGGIGGGGQGGGSNGQPSQATNGLSGTTDIFTVVLLTPFSCCLPLSYTLPALFSMTLTSLLNITNPFLMTLFTNPFFDVIKAQEEVGVASIPEGHNTSMYRVS